MVGEKEKFKDSFILFSQLTKNQKWKYDSVQVLSCDLINNDNKSL